MCTVNSKSNHIDLVRKQTDKSCNGCNTENALEVNRKLLFEVPTMPCNAMLPKHVPTLDTAQYYHSSVQSLHFSKRDCTVNSELRRLVT